MDITVAEIQEQPLYNQLHIRDQLIATSKGYGPPDLCYLVIESTNIFGSTNTQGYYHYVYGADVSTSASVAAYINTLQNKLSDNKTSKRKIVNGIFCIYNSFFKFDIRVEINMPGMTVCYALIEGKKRSPKEIEWDCAFISSVLRCFHAIPCDASHRMKLLSSDKLFIEFLNSVLRVYKKRFSLCVPIDIPHQSPLPLFWYLSEFLKEKKRLNESLEFFETLYSEDEEFSVFVADFLCSIGRHSEALHLVAKGIVQSPFNTSLLYKEAVILGSLQRYKDAIQVGKHLVSKAADSFQSWLQLASMYLLDYQLRDFLLALDLCPVSANIQYVTFHPTSTESSIDENEGLTEEMREPMDLLNDINFGPTEPDFESLSKPTVDQKTIEEQENEVRLTQNMIEAPYNYLSFTEKKIYNKLAELEKMIGWYNLLSICATIFDIDHEDTNILGSQISISTKEKWGAKGIKLKPMKSIFLEIIKIDRNVLKVTNSNSQSSNETISSSPEDFNFSENFIPVITKEDSELNKQMLENQISQIKEKTHIKTKSLKISVLLRVMHYDLIMLQEWEYEANKDYPMGIAWVLRGDLALRLHRLKYAEKAFLFSLKFGISLYSLRKLMELYCPAHISACLKCMSEISVIVQGKAQKILKVMPDWIENIFFSLVEKVGLKCVINKLKKNELIDCYYLLNAVEKCKYWRAEGYNR